jgi:hypothetical protein
MEGVNVQGGQQVQDGVEPVVLEIVQVMKWISFDEAKAERVAAQIGGNQAPVGVVDEPAVSEMVQLLLMERL